MANDDADQVQTDAESETGGGAQTDQSVSWTASEFIHHEKSAGWYLVLILASLMVAGLIYLVTKDGVATGVVVVAALVLAYYGAHQPRQLEYKVDQGGVSIGNKYHPYNSFKSFSVQPEGAFSSIVFMPLKRFAPPTTIYYPPEDEARIIEILAGHLPLEEPRPDAVNSLMRRIRF